MDKGHLKELLISHKGTCDRVSVTFGHTEALSPPTPFLGEHFIQKFSSTRVSALERSEIKDPKYDV